MNNFEKEIIDMIPGDTPRQKFEFMERLRQFMLDLAFPKRGFEADAWNIGDIAEAAEHLQLLSED